MTFEDLPHISQSHVQSEESAQALLAVLCLPDFICRKQDPDYGKDYEVELAINSDATNIQFSVQLKSVQAATFDKAEANITFSIETSRLHYLSKTICGSLVVVYDVGSKTLFFEWVHELIRGLDKSTKDWRKNEFVTIHIPVGNVLDRGRVSTLHTEVSTRYTQIQASIQVPIAPTLPMIVASQTDSEVLGSTDQKRKLETLLVDGLALASSGQHNSVIEAYASIPSSQWQDIPRHILIIAYAYEHFGLPLQTLTYSNSYLATVDITNTSRSEIALGKYLQLNAQLNTGQIGSKVYNAGLRQLAKDFSDCPEILQVNLQLILVDMFEPEASEDPQKNSDELLNRARKIVSERSKGADNARTYNWNLELLLARIEFHYSVHCLMVTTAQLRSSVKIGYGTPLLERLEMVTPALTAHSTAFKRLEGIYEFAKKMSRADIIGYCDFEMVFNQINFIMTMRALGLVNPSDESQKKSILEDCLNRIKNAVKIFQDRGFRGLRFKALGIEIDVLELLGRDADAKSGRESLRKEAASLGFPPRMAELSMIRGFQSIKPPSGEETAEELISSTDEQLRERAAQMVHMLRIPKERAENIFKDLVSMRLMYVEQRKWCKHLALLQGLRHTFARETIYSIDPTRIWKCEKYGYESAIPHKDPIPLLAAFKSAHCQKCTGREV